MKAEKILESLKKASEEKNISIECIGGRLSSLERVIKLVDILGYEIKLVKKSEKIRLLPCVCGCNRRDHLYSVGHDPGDVLSCKKCGLRVKGKNLQDARRNWNKMIIERSKDDQNTK